MSRTAALSRVTVAYVVRSDALGLVVLFQAIEDTRRFGDIPLTPLAVAAPQRLVTEFCSVFFSIAIKTLWLRRVLQLLFARSRCDF